MASSPNGLKHMSGLPHLTLIKHQWDHTGSPLDCTTVLGEAGTRDARNAGKACFHAPQVENVVAGKHGMHR